MITMTNTLEMSNEHNLGGIITTKTIMMESHNTYGNILLKLKKSITESKKSKGKLPDDEEIFYVLNKNEILALIKWLNITLESHEN